MKTVAGGGQRIVRVTTESGIPLTGCIAFGIIDRGTNLLQVRATTICNMNCRFCSTDGGLYSKYHKTHFVVDVPYLVEETAKVVRVKGDGVIIFLDSVGEPLCHPEFVQLVKGVGGIKGVAEVVMITNGTLLTKEKVDALRDAGLDRANVSLHATSPDTAKMLFGMESYNVENVMDMIRYMVSKNLVVMITPVWLPGVNDEEIERVIRLCKETGCMVGLQKYEVYPFSRKMKKAKKINYWKFREQLKVWEKEYGVPLLMKRGDVHVEKRERIEEVLDIGERVRASVVAPGWYPHQRIAVVKERCVSIVNCSKDVGDLVNIRIVENKNNIYMAEQV